MKSLFRLAPALALLAIALLVVSSGCRRSNGGGNGAGDIDGSVDPSEVSIYEVQSDDMPPGTPVTLRGVVVTAIDTFGARTGSVYVMEPAGGPFSGVLVFLSGTEAASLSPGDLVDVVGGVKAEFALEQDDSGRTLTQIVAPQGGRVTITRVGQGTIPDPEVVLPQVLAADDDEAEKWEGVLIKFENVRVHRAPAGVTQTDPTLKEMTVTGPFRISSSLTELSEDIERGDCYAEIVGIGDYFFTYKLLPRSPADLTRADTDTCLPPEEGEAMCGDGEDNDFDGFADCEDFSCQATVAACTAATIVDIQSGAISPGASVQLANVVVTGRSFNNKRFWIQDEAAAAPHNGIFVFRPGGAEDLPAGVDIGATLDVAGQVSVFGGLTQLQFVDFSDPVAAGLTPTPVPLALATVADETAGAPYQGVLVTLENVEVVNPNLGNGALSLGDGAATLVVDDDIYRVSNDFTLTAGQCLSRVTGIVHRDVFATPSHITLLPRGPDDIDDAPGSCE